MVFVLADSWFFPPSVKPFFLPARLECGKGL
jgi:hypothetical protein